MSIFPINHWSIVYVERQISHAFWKYRDRNHLSFSVMLTRLKLGMSERAVETAPTATSCPSGSGSSLASGGAGERG